MSELTDAVKAGDAARVNALVDADASVLTAAENGVTPLLLAIYHGKVDVAWLMVERGAPVSFGEACALGDEARVKEMLGADPRLLHSRTADGFPSAGMAIFFGHGALARWLIEQGADVNAPAENAMRVAPVHAAAAACDRETMRMLLERGADANARQQMDYTALHGAAGRGDVEMAKLLLAHGAQRDAKGSDGKTPAIVAREHGHPAFAEWIESSRQVDESSSS
ncbi:MAG TPA: ankyrin repeat domain-containing protein [Thermoanaerobaculia bacterium]|jgi:ankyrin repeat protein|nr:ankyrin repeat domain-containing protein [Thermoanaerobaculia bacterium]